MTASVAVVVVSTRVMSVTCAVIAGATVSAVLIVRTIHAGAAMSATTTLVPALAVWVATLIPHRG